MAGDNDDSSFVYMREIGPNTIHPQLTVNSNLTRPAEIYLTTTGVVTPAAAVVVVVVVTENFSLLNSLPYKHVLTNYIHVHLDCESDVIMVVTSPQPNSVEPRLISY